MGVNYLPARGAVKSIQSVTVSVNMAASSSGTITTTISEVDPDRCLVLPPSQWSSMGSVTNLGVISHRVSGPTSLETQWENDSGNDPGAITVRVFIVEYY